MCSSPLVGHQQLGANPGPVPHTCHAPAVGWAKAARGNSIAEVRAAQYHILAPTSQAQAHTLGTITLTTVYQFRVSDHRYCRPLPNAMRSSGVVTPSRLSFGHARDKFPPPLDSSVCKIKYCLKLKFASKKPVLRRQIQKRSKQQNNGAQRRAQGSSLST